MSVTNLGVFTHMGLKAKSYKLINIACNVVGNMLILIIDGEVIPEIKKETKTMRKYIVRAVETICHSWEVEADSQEQAEELAQEMCPCDQLPPAQICAKNDYQTVSVHPL